MYNKDKGTWYNRTVSPIFIRNLELINSEIGFRQLYPDEQSYAEEKARAYKAEQENRKIINDREHFTSALYESTSKVFKPLTKKQDESLKEEQNIVKEISDLSKSLKAIKEEPKREEDNKNKRKKRI